MGCDIHSYVEVMKNQRWILHTPEPGYTWRDYGMFGILAGVRMRGFNPMAKHRGLPKNVSKEVKELADEYGGDGHTHSYLTLKEILDYDYDQTIPLHGVLSAKKYDQWDKKSTPYLDYANSEYVLMPEAYKLLKQNNALDKNVDYYIKTTWNSPYRSFVNGDWWAFVERLKGYAEEFGGNENVRYIFWFDN